MGSCGYSIDQYAGSFLEVIKLNAKIDFPQT